MSRVTPHSSTEPKGKTSGRRATKSSKRPSKPSKRSRKVAPRKNGAALQTILPNGRGFEFGLAEIIYPIKPATFFRTYWERKPLIINRRNRNYYRDLLTLEDIDQVITSMNLPYPEIELVNAKDPIGRNQYVRNNNSIDVAKLCLLYTSPSPRDQRGSRMPSSA